jgi:hypothetical protein
MFKDSNYSSCADHKMLFPKIWDKEKGIERYPRHICREKLPKLPRYYYYLENRNNDEIYGIYYLSEIEISLKQFNNVCFPIRDLLKSEDIERHEKRQKEDRDRIF